VVIEAQEIAAIRGIVIRTLPCRVVSMQRLAPDVMALRLKLPQSEKFHFMAGQYIDILLPGGRRRSYSIASAPHDDEFLQLHIRHLPGGLFSGQVFDRMQEKDLLRFRGPLGTFFLREDSARPLILVAGGTGFAPMKSIIEHMLHGGMKRPVHLYWGGRTPHDLYMHDLAQSWTRATDLLRYTPVLSQPVTGDNWQGRTGLAHEAVVQDYPDLSGYDIYASGPPAMIGSARQAFTGRGLPDAAFFSDSFEHARDGAQDAG
jgi:CDP-4-dehydro-6-deoxyglucose reductase